MGDIRYFRNDDGVYTEQLGLSNPFDAISISYASPAFVDVDDDGDPDLLVGENTGEVFYFKNDGGTFNAVVGPSNPFDGIDVGDIANPVFADIDADSDPDLIIGAQTGDLKYFQNNGGTFTELTGVDNPFDGISVGIRSFPFFADFDGDGDLDIFIGEKYGTISYFQNNGGTFTELTGGNNPADGIGLEFLSAPTLVDMDDDGDLDLVAGNYEASILNYFRNEEGTLVEKRGTGNPFEGLIVGDAASLTFGDYDQDGDQELAVGDFSGNVYFFENDGEFLVPVEGVDNPFDGLTFQNVCTPVLADIDGEGDLDLLAGNAMGTIQYFVNDAGDYVELTGAGNPFDGIDIGVYSAPAVCDFDDDGDLDLFIGTNAGTIVYYKNVTGVYVGQTGVDNPFDGIDFGSYIRPLFKDVDGDGDLDLVIEDDTSNSILYYENVEGVYTERTGFENPFDGFGLNVPSVAFYDFDKDGDDDLYIGEFSGDVYLAEYIPPGVEINTGSGLTTSEEGGTSIFTVVLESQPKADVEIDLESTDTGEGTVDPSSLTFTNANWDTPQVVTVTGVDDTEVDGDQTYDINFTIISADPEYDGMTIPSAGVTNTDDDDPSALSAHTLEPINIYVTDKVIVLDAGDLVIDQVEVFNISGSMIASEIVGTSGRYELPVSDANTGIYFVRVYSNSNVNITKILIK
ncbi:hypothetical protein ES705_21070 [subsurface metagenome]